MKEKNETIRNRESWLKVGVITFFSLVIGIPLFWCLITGQISLDFGSLNFESLLAVLISFFAIFLSVLFYFKATESSNHFYNNSYTFTKDISETLRGIEAGFGEKLKNIDKGYDDFRKTFENYISPDDKKEIKKEVEEEKEKLKEIIREKDNLISELETKTNLSKQELNKYLKQIKEKELELRETNNQIQFIKHQLKSESEFNVSEDKYHDFRMYIKSRFLSNVNSDILASRLLIRKYFKKMSTDFHPSFLKDMEKAGFIDVDGNLSGKGVDFIRRIANDN